MVRVLLAAVLAVAPAAAQDDDVYGIELDSGYRSLQKGRLDRAAYHFEEVLLAFDEEVGDDRPSADQVAAARTGMTEILVRRGEYEDALHGLGGLAEDEAVRRPNRRLQARAFVRLGRYDEALAVLQGLADDASDYESRYRLASLRERLGQDEPARAGFEALIDDATTARGTVDPVRLGWAGRAAAALGQVQRAADWFVDAVQGAPEDPSARVAYGQLLFEVYGEAAGFPSGEKALLEALDRNGDHEEALLALYRLRRSNQVLDFRKTEGYLDRLLTLNPRSVPGLLERATLVLGDRRFEEGRAIVDRALEINPRHPEALALRAAAAHVLNDGDGYRTFRQRALDVDPTFPGVDVTLGDLLVRLYRFGDALPLYTRALEADPDSIPALHGLAKALIYVGNGKDALPHLERAAELQRGYVSPWRNNAIAVQELLTEEYVSVRRDNIELTMHSRDAAVLQEYLMPLYQEAVSVLGQKYGYRPDEVVRVEVLRTWDDFSVRTTGFRGFTALGACFGPLITLVSPRDGDLRRQDFMWAATVWHEYVHVLTLAVSRHRVPRWLTEGCSVHEEKARNPLWERGMQRELFDAYHNGEIAPVRLLNRLFRGPRILFGYFQGGLIVDLVSEEYGFDKVRDMLEGYGRDLSTEEVFETALGISTQAFDAKLLARVEEILAPLVMVPTVGRRLQLELLDRVARNADDLEARLLLGWCYVQRNNPVDAGRELAYVLRAEPQNGGALLLQAALLVMRDETDKALDRFAAGFAAGGDDFDSRLAYGRLLEAEGRIDEALAQYRRAKACWPECTDQADAPELHLARIHALQGDEDLELQELTVFIQRTARAFQPRLRLAAHRAEQGQYAQAAILLKQAVQIDPFMREVHERLAECYVELGDFGLAARELEVAASVPPSLDRAYLSGDPPAPEDDGDEDRAARRDLYERASQLWTRAGNEVRAREAAEKAAR